MKKCELCEGLARMHCESDQANLCWDCDVKVHGANFLVAKHPRTLLCHVCQNPTPWLASGPNLSPAVSVCESCVGTNNKTNSNCEVAALPEESSEEEYDEEDYEDEDEEEEEEEVEDGENQVVPWSGESSSSSLSTLKPVASSDSFSSNDGGGSRFGLKRMRENHNFYSDDEIGCSSSHVGSGGSTSGESSSMASSRLLKQPRLYENQDHGETESRSTAIISSLQRLQKHMITNDGDASATILRICRLSRDQSH
ncbi:Zinc finger, B-box [Corchorus olitorius]|uniref:Zinc finger, B-box n=1 Tax=Corchorus olitorius TaxID=93759 RepID=A0A1R3KBY7_9ROSI|nr:Zinc finger, B-box [Corchorus olitorius]